MTERIIDRVSGPHLMEYSNQIAQWVRLSGTEDERAAFEYIKDQLAGFGYETEIHESDALIGYPAESSLILHGDSQVSMECNGYSLSPKTPDEGVTGELVYVAAGKASDYENIDVRGKIVVSDGLAMPEKTVASQAAGAIGQIHINDDHIHEMCISPVWGTPTPETAHMLPAVPSISVNGENGAILKERMETGTFEVTLITKPFREWVKIPTLIADLNISGEGNSEYVLFSGHVDSWHYGAMDNGTANATQMEVARLLADRKDELRRGIRLAFWSGHSHGRYAGSAWYADANWQDIHDNCICHVNVDSVGAIGASVLEDAPTMPETYQFAAEVIREVTGRELEYRRISRSSDQSFWGHGVSSIFCTFSEQEIEQTATAKAQAQLLGASGRGGGLGWWWHTTEDLMDKIDEENLVRDAKVYAEVLWRLTTVTRLPFDYSETARDIAENLKMYMMNAADRIDLTRQIAQAETLHESLASFDWSTLSDQQANSLQKDLRHALVPVHFTKTGPFDHDLALSSRPIPALAAVERLANLESGSDDFHFLRTRLIRDANRVGHGLSNAQRAVQRMSE